MDPATISAAAASAGLTKDIAIKWWGEAWDEISTDNRARFILLKCAVPDVPAAVALEYVERPRLRGRFVEHMSDVTPEKYMVVVGPRGGGKTTTVRRSLTGRSKVMYVKLETGAPTLDVAWKQKLRIKPGTFVTIRDVFECLKGLAGDEKPVLVIEIDSGASTVVVAEPSQALKELAVDEQLVHGIIVLSDANAAFKLKQDSGCQDFLWVGDFERDEALAFLDKRGVLSTDGEPADDGELNNSKLRRRLLDEAGANPQMLKRASKKVRAAVDTAIAAVPEGASEADQAKARRAAEHGAVEAFVEARYKDAKAEVSNLLTVSSYQDTARRLVRLLLTMFPGGVAEEDGGFSADDLGEAVKREHHHALSYNSETGLCQFYSPAHERAARAWFEKEEAERKRLERRWFGLGRFFT